MVLAIGVLGCGSSHGGASSSAGARSKAGCAVLQCAAQASCVDGGQDAHCVCGSGYEGDGRSCKDIDECAVSPSVCGADATCLNLSGSYRCDCKLGYQADEHGDCRDIDECMADACDRLVSCENVPGSFRCGKCPGDAWGQGDRNPGCNARASAVAAGAFHSCALLENGSVKCWGNNENGELGQGDKMNRGAAAADLGDALAVVDLGKGRSATAISAGSLHTCALLDDRSVKCWGNNGEGQLGLGDSKSRGDDPNEMGDALASVDLGDGASATAIAVGDAHSCALLAGGSVKCWGGNEKGQLGQGDSKSRGSSADTLGQALSAVALGSGRTARAIAAGGANTCAVLDDASVKCWGDNQYGQLGQGDTDPRGDRPGEMGDQLAPIALGDKRRALAVAVGTLGFACALLDDGSVKCWGGNQFGQLGLGDAESRGDGPLEMGDALPTLSLGSGASVTAIALGGAHSCAILGDQSTKCWGINQYATLGLEDFDERGDASGEMGDALPAIALGQQLHAVMVSPGRANHTCAVLSHGEIKCWGSNGIGQLGVGDIRSRGGMRGDMGDNLPAVHIGHPGPARPQMFFNAGQ